MENVFPRFLLASTLLFSASGLTSCLKQNIKYVDQNRVFEEVAGFKAVKDSIGHFQEAWKAEAKKIQDLANAMAIRLTDAASLKPGQIDSIRVEQGRLNSDWQRFVKVKTEQEANLQGSLMAPLVPKINACLDKFIGDHGIDYLLGTQQGGVILASRKSNDWSQKVIDYLNKECK